jgi:hypothetical protein
MKRICENCKWWRKEGQKEIEGITLSECHRLPPVIDFTTSGEMKKSMFPFAPANSFCGEFEPE